MTRVTPLPRDLAKLTRSLGSTVAAPRNSQLLNSGSRTIAAKLRKELEHGIAEVPASEVRSPFPSPPLPALPFSDRFPKNSLSVSEVVDQCSLGKALPLPKRRTSINLRHPSQINNKPLPIQVVAK